MKASCCLSRIQNTSNIPGDTFLLILEFQECFGVVSDDVFGLGMSEWFSNNILPESQKKKRRKQNDGGNRIRMPITSKQTWSTAELTVIELFTCESSPSVNYIWFLFRVWIDCHVEHFCACTVPTSPGSSECKLLCIIQVHEHMRATNQCSSSWYHRMRVTQLPREL